MGIVNPRPSMRQAERRAVEDRLRRLEQFTRQFIDEGFGREEASRRAFMMVKMGAKPKPEGTTP